MNDLISKQSLIKNLNLLLNRSSLGEISFTDTISVGEICSLINNEPIVHNVEELIDSIENKMTDMCGCRNCIETISHIIRKDRKPFNSQCKECGRYEECKKK